MENSRNDTLAPLHLYWGCDCPPCPPRIDALDPRAIPIPNSSLRPFIIITLLHTHQPSRVIPGYPGI